MKQGRHSTDNNIHTEHTVPHIQSTGSYSIQSAPSAHTMSDSTELHLPPHLPFPIKLVSHAAHPSASVQRGTCLLNYSFSYTLPNAQKETRFGTWDSSVEGTIDKWNFHPGDTISQRKAREIAALTITEPCKHGVQLGGLCCLCGKDMTM